MNRAWHAFLPFVICITLLALPLLSYGQADPLSVEGFQGAEKLLLQEIPSVYSASKYEQKVTEAPASVSIVTADEIKKFGYRTLADILRSVRGFHVTYDRNYSYVGVRGFAPPGDYNTRLLLLVDGQRINDNVYDMAFVGTEFVLDVDLIERVEIVRGPSSSLYGNNAFFGVINVITKRGRDLQGAEISGEAGSYDTYKGRLSYGRTLPWGLEGVLSGSFYTSNGQRLFYKEFDDPASNNGVAENSDDDQFYSIFGKLSWRDFTLEGALSSREKGIPTGAYETVFNDPRSRTTDEQGYIDLKYEHNFGTQWSVMARLAYHHYYYSGNYLYDYPPITLNKDKGVGEWWGGELQVTTRALPRQTLTFGTEYRYNLHQDQKNFDPDPFAVYLDEHRDSQNWALYVQDSIMLFKSLSLNLGVRYDHYDSFGGTTNPRLALIYNPFALTTVKLLYGTAFRAPNAYERFYTASDGQKANPGLEPETITTYELIVEQYLGEHLRGTAAAFAYKLDNLITFHTDPKDGVRVFDNVEEITAHGLELELEGKWASGLMGRLSYTYQETKNEQTGRRLTNAPRHLAKFNLSVPLYQDKLFSGLEMQYTSARKTRAGGEAKGFLVTNLTLFSQHVLKGLEVSASIYNLFDVHYGDPGSEEHRQEVIPQDGRAFRLKLTYGF